MVYLVLFYLHTSDIRAVQLVLLDVNYSLDCQRACDNYPDFYNDVFAYLCLNDTPQTIVPL